MFITPLMAAIIVGSFWTGVGATAVVNGGINHPPRSDVVISASATDHDEACAVRYRSYDPSTGKYLSTKGVWKDCPL
jgi:hypothetical protein